MKIEATEFLPLARRDAIITKEVDGELLVYDVTRDKAHCLNETAAAVWRLCDGRTSVAAISERLAVSGEQTADDSRQSAVGSRQTAAGSVLTPDTRHPTPHTQIIWLALDQLRRSHLLEEADGENDKTSWAATLPGFANMSRREAVRRIGLGAAITLPLVISMTAPTAVEAAVSCGAKCKACNTGADCCSGVCAPPPVGTCPGGSPRCV